MRKLLFVLIFNFGSYCLGQIHDFNTANFKKADSIATLHKVKKLNNLPKLAYNLTHNLVTPIEKFRAIYTWVSLNIDSDYYYQEKIMKVRKKFEKDSLSLDLWNKKNRAKFFKKLINHKSTICTGYAYLVKELAFLSGIECKIIDGYGRNANLNIKRLGLPNHSWNAVFLNKKWYLCDPTWSSGYTHITNKETKFIHKYHDGYFLTDPELFIKSHYPLDKKWTLYENSMPPNEFIKAPFIYDETFQNKIIPLEPKQLVSTIEKNQFLNFKFKTLKKVDQNNIFIEINNGNSPTTVTPVFTDFNQNNLAFKYQFDKKGLFDVHVKINQDIISTYTVKVKKHIK